jgi:hypothetical protein
VPHDHLSGLSRRLSWGYSLRSRPHLIPNRAHRLTPPPPPLHPTVAVLWTWFIGRVSGIHIPAASLAAMGLAVWILYAADRLLDARLLNATPLAQDTGLEPRHLFHHRHRNLFLAGILLASIALAPLLVRLPAEAMRLYLMEGSLLIGWFLLIHIAPGERRLPKELAVGPFFAAATFIPTVARIPAQGPSLILPATLFAALCTLNCLFIYAWEHTTPTRRIDAHPSTRLGLRLLPALPVALIAAALAVACRQPRLWPLDLAVTLSAAALLLLNRQRGLPPTTLRAAADLALLTPILLISFLSP